MTARIGASALYFNPHPRTEGDGIPIGFPESGFYFNPHPVSYTHLVFECLLDPAQCRMLQAKLLSIMDEELDSLRFYYLGSRYEQKIQHFGRNAGYQPEGVLMV